MDDRLKRAYASACKYCAYRERAPKQVFDKLVSWGYAEEDAESIISILKAEKFLDEERFIRAFCHDKFEFNQWGRIKMRVELSRYSLPGNLVEDGLYSISEGRYLEVLQELASRKWESLSRQSDDDFKNRQKAAQYLMRKGFEGDLVWNEVKALT